MQQERLRLFEGVGIELEYMIVDADSLAVRPIADQLLREVGGGYELEVELGATAWSNELALHVIEMKTNGPASNLRGLGALFQEQVTRIDQLLDGMGARLLPSAMHPWMDPATELRLWPHEGDAVYRAFDRVFDCRGHGWANLQSTHINLPFGDDREFGRLHAALRVLLPILPALAASSPFVDGRASGMLDTRLDVYRNNARSIPSVTGAVIPEPVFTQAEYEGGLLRRIYNDLAPHDPEGVLQHEWVNSRGCIARFDRSAIEIRVLDVQECPGADIAIAGAAWATARALDEERWAGQTQLRSWHHAALAEILTACTADADRAVIGSADYLRLFGFPERAPCLARELWQHLCETIVSTDPGYGEWAQPLETIVRSGCLARRLRTAGGDAPSLDRLRTVYRHLADCLRTGRLFDPHAV